MAGRNGVAVLPSMRFSVIPKSVPFEIERPNPDDPTGEPIVITLRAWDKTLPHPAQVDIAIEGALDVYRDALWQEQQWAQEHPGETRTMPLEQASVALHADILGIVIEGLEPAEVDILVAATGPWQEILVARGWWRRAEDQAEAPSDDKADADDPEVPGEPATTTSGFSPDSADSTASTRGAA